MRVIWIWHAAVVAEYRKPMRELSRCPDLDLTLLIPKRWPERAGQMVHAEEVGGQQQPNYHVVCAHTLFTGLYYLYIYPSLLYHLLKRRPDIIYCYEEAHTLVAACVLLLRRLFLPRSKVLLYAAQNIKKRYPPPFRHFESYCFRRVDGILACGRQVAATLRSKGYRGPLHVVALPTDVHTFAPDPAARVAARREWGLAGDEALVAGYAGKLVEEKGLRTLLAAFGSVAHRFPNSHLVLAGGGPLQAELVKQAAKMGLADRVRFVGVVHNSELPRFMNGLDAFVLPSETRPNWREQFGRVAVEAMSCGVPVIGSDSGEIPNVLGEAGLVFPEGDAEALARCLTLLFHPQAKPERERLSRLGRERVLSFFSVERVAARHLAIYEALAGRRADGSSTPEP